MLYRWAAVALVLALGALAPAPAAGQRAMLPSERKLGTLGQNFPNPFKPDTWIPFTVDDCNGPNGQRVVSMRVYNVLAQLVATPVLHGAGVPITGIPLSCGSYLAHWDGHVARGRRKADSGVYVYELVIDGQRSSRKMFVAR
ncbi:MAG TPA: hypothetical protein VFP15_00010 [Gemmatimonadaceae bacterium]|nr:hypothetical protein [Gemmatimonadaceae bacterium]